MSATISREELKSKLDRGDDFHLIETLPEESFREEHLPTASNIPPDEIKQRASQVVPDENADVVLYCANSECDASHKAAESLKELGYTNVRRYPEGKQDWVDAGLPTHSEESAKAGKK